LGKNRPRGLEDIRSDQAPGALPRREIPRRAVEAHADPRRVEGRKPLRKQ